MATVFQEPIETVLPFTAYPRKPRNATSTVSQVRCKDLQLLKRRQWRRLPLWQSAMSHDENQACGVGDIQCHHLG